MSRYGSVTITSPTSVLTRIVESADPLDLEQRVNDAIASLPQQGYTVVDITLAGAGDGHTFTVTIEAGFIPDTVGGFQTPPTVTCFLASEAEALLLARLASSLTSGTLADTQVAGSSKGTRFMGMLVNGVVIVPAAPQIFPLTSRAYTQFPPDQIPGDGSAAVIPGVVHTSVTGRVIVVNKIVLVLGPAGPAGSGRVLGTPFLDGLPYPPGPFQSSLAYIVPGFDAASLPVGGGWGTMITHAFADPVPGPHTYDLQLIHQGPALDPARMLLLSDATTIVEDVFI